MTKIVFWLSIMVIATVLVAGSLAMSPVAIADDNHNDKNHNDKNHDDKNHDDKKNNAAKERVSITTQLTNSCHDDPRGCGLRGANGGVTVLLDTTGSGFLSTVHVAATLPSSDGGCDNSQPPAGRLVIVAGIAGVTIPPGIPIITSGAENTGFPGDATGSCVYHATVTAPTPGAITDVVIVNGVLDGQSHVDFPPGTTVTVTGTYE